MNPQVSEILGELERRGVVVAVVGDALSLKPRRALDEIGRAHV